VDLYGSLRLKSRERAGWMAYKKVAGHPERN
jgi:hypothetical protein